MSPLPHREGFASAFQRDDGHVWLNCAHQGPLPSVAADALAEALRWKLGPYELTAEKFRTVPERLRKSLARLIGAEPDEVILANSASYGLHLIANGLRLEDGDEVLVMATDFPSDILPWLRLQREGVIVTQLRPRGHVLEPDEIRDHINSRVRVLCLTWVHSFSGWTVDLDAIGSLCRDHGILFVVNASQAIGARPLDVKATPVDALVSVGFKWLCGPYGTGFCWIRKELLARLEPLQAYWLAMLSADDLARSVETRLPDQVDYRSFDVFGTANFFNFVPWNAAIEYLSTAGIAAIADYDQQLIQKLIDGLDGRRFVISSPRSGSSRSTLLVLSDRVEERNTTLYERLSAAGIHVALRAGRLRLSPHLYNTNADVDRALTILNEG
jgi:cysteine desulfurase / selenocysteine lyase